MSANVLFLCTNGGVKMGAEGERVGRRGGGGRRVRSELEPVK